MFSGVSNLPFLFHGLYFFSCVELSCFLWNIELLYIFICVCCSINHFDHHFFLYFRDYFVFSIASFIYFFHFIISESSRASLLISSNLLCSGLVLVGWGYGIAFCFYTLSFSVFYFCTVLFSMFMLVDFLCILLYHKYWSFPSKWLFHRNIF